MSQLFALLERDASGRTILAAPRIGVFRPHRHALVAEPGVPIGRQQILHKRIVVLSPPGVHGSLELLVGPGPVAVGYGQPLARVLERAAAAVDVHSPTEAELEGNLSAPTHGIFYRRPTPSAAAFVEVGSRVRPGQTLGLIEVMKTFHPVVYDEDGTLGEGTVEAIFAGEAVEVKAGQPLFRIAVAGR